MKAKWMQLSDPVGKSEIHCLRDAFGYTRAFAYRDAGGRAYAVGLFGSEKQILEFKEPNCRLVKRHINKQMEAFEA